MTRRRDLSDPIREHLLWRLFSIRRAGRELAERAQRAADERDAALRRIVVDTVTATTDQPYVDALVAFFKARAKRMAHG